MRMEKTFDDRYKKYFFFSVFFAYLSFCLSSCPAVFFFILSQSDHMHVLYVYIKLYSIVKVIWWNQEVAELFAFVFFCICFSSMIVSKYTFLYVCMHYIYTKNIYVYVCIWFCTDYSCSLSLSLSLSC